MDQITTQNEKVKQGAEDAGRYFRYMAQFVGFTQAHADAIQESRYIIEKYIPDIVAQFYTNLLDYAPTRKVFLKKDGTDECTHAEGPLSEGELKAGSIICPWHDSCFDVSNGQVQRGPATQPLKTFRVIVQGDIARVE